MFPPTIHSVACFARVLAAATLLIGSSSLRAQESVEITGSYQLEIACYETFHEELSMVVDVADLQVMEHIEVTQVQTSK